MMLFNRDSAIQKSFQKILHSLQVRKLGSLQAVQTTCHTVRTLIYQSIIRPDDENFPSGCPSLSRSFDSSWLHLSERNAKSSGRSSEFEKIPVFQCIHPNDVATPSGRFSVFNQASDSFQVQLWEDWCNRPDDVDSRPDALLLKARITIQIQLSGRQSAIVQTCDQQIQKLWIRLEPSGRLPFMVRTHAQ